ncbi:zinc finger BED domain-containing protein 4-like [Armigeres subalbatus]|uniref:zinc finger BED domain-containing protein 4-like n=1 Tax=Armigeres subalbatus TaxID=124917 RepID=UPI002ED34574
MLPAEFTEFDSDDAQEADVKEDTNDFENEKDGTSDILVNDDDSEEPVILDSIRCGAHTAQLVAYDVIKLHNKRLGQINKICQKMHHKTSRELFVLHKIALPPKVNETRWGVWFIVLRYLQVLRSKPFLATLQNHDSTLDLSQHWKFIDRFCDAFEPIYVLTLKLQKDHVPLSDFYADWLVCQAKLNAIKKQGNTLAAKLHTSMQKRVEKLRSSMAFKASLYLDPRFNFAGSARLTPEEKREAQEYLIALSNRLDVLEGLQEELCTDDGEASTSGFVEDYLMDFFNEASNDTASSSSEKRAANESLRDELSKLEKRNKVNITSQPAPAASESSTRFDILQYWKKRKFSSPRLYRLAMVVLAAPSTQVTVERLFSQLKYILTDRRMQLYGVSVHDIMILKMNPDLLIEVVETLLEHHAI